MGVSYIPLSATSNHNVYPIILDSKDDTKIRFTKSGNYIIIGKVAGCLKESFEDDDVEYEHRPAIHLDVCNSFGALLQTMPEVVSFTGDEPYNNKLAEYGHINDVISVEDHSYLRVRGSNGACFAKHGTVPFLFDKLPTQSLTAMKLDPRACVDRYVIISTESGRINLQRALGGNHDQEALFIMEQDDERSHVLKAKSSFQCIVLCTVSSLFGSKATLLKSNDPIVHSELCKGSGRGSHCLNAVLDLEENDCVKLSGSKNNTSVAGHLAFVQLIN